MFLRNSYYNIILITVFFLILLLPSIDNVLKFSEHLPIHLKESRKPPEFPSIRKDNGKIGGGQLKRFPKRFEEYYKDNFGLRNLIINFGNKIFLSKDSGSKGYFFGQNDWIFINKNTTSDVLGLQPLAEFQVNKAVEHLYKSWQFLIEQNIEYLFVLIPVKQTIYPEFLPKYMASVIEKKQNIVTGSDQIVNELLRRYPDFPILDLRSILKEIKEKKDQRILYHQTDAHWNGLGVQYGYEAIYENLKKRGINMNRADFFLSEEFTKKGDLAEIAGNFPEYYSSFIRVRGSNRKKIESSIFIDEIKDVTLNYYNIETSVEVNQYENPISDDLRVYVQHDSYFRYEYDMHAILADSFREVLFFYNPMRSNLVCEVYRENIRIYKPNLVIQEMIERDLIEYCKK